MKIQKMVRKTTSLKVEEEIWKDVKIYCIKNNLEISEFVEELLKKGVKK
jgi:hypothetical protein